MCVSAFNDVDPYLADWSGGFTREGEWDPYNGQLMRGGWQRDDGYETDVFGRRLLVAALYDITDDDIHEVFGYVPHAASSGGPAAVGPPEDPALQPLVADYLPTIAEVLACDPSSCQGRNDDALDVVPQVSPVALEEAATAIMSPSSTWSFRPASPSPVHSGEEEQGGTAARTVTPPPTTRKRQAEEFCETISTQAPEKKSRNRSPPPEVKVRVMDCDVNEKCVLSGRGERTNNHAGNIVFRKVVCEERPGYKALTTKEEKIAYTKRVVKRLHEEYGLTFLTWDKETGESWYVTSEKATHYKVSQALRDLSPEASKAKRQATSSKAIPAGKKGAGKKGDGKKARANNLVNMRAPVKKNKGSPAKKNAAAVAENAAAKRNAARAARPQVIGRSGLSCPVSP